METLNTFFKQGILKIGNTSYKGQHKKQKTQTKRKITGPLPSQSKWEQNSPSSQKLASVNCC